MFDRGGDFKFQLLLCFQDLPSQPSACRASVLLPEIHTLLRPGIPSAWFSQSSLPTRLDVVHSQGLSCDLRVPCSPPDLPSLVHCSCLPEFLNAELCLTCLRCKIGLILSVPESSLKSKSVALWALLGKAPCTSLKTAAHDFGCSGSLSHSVYPKLHSSLSSRGCVPTG